MDNFIRVYQNAFSDELCDRLISKFESTELEESKILTSATNGDQDILKDNGTYYYE